MSNRTLPGLPVLLLAVCAPLVGQQNPRMVSCPGSITVNETAAAVAGWSASTSKSVHAFERISVYNGKAGGEEYELAPDDQKEQGGRIVQTWNLNDYRSMNLFLRCRYQGTPVVLSVDLPRPLATCTFRFTTDRQGKITGKSEMQCR